MVGCSKIIQYVFLRLKTKWELNSCFQDGFSKLRERRSTVKDRLLHQKNVMKKKKEKEKNIKQDVTDEIERQDHSFVWESRYERWAPPFISPKAFPAKMYSWVPENTL